MNPLSETLKINWGDPKQEDRPMAEPHRSFPREFKLQLVREIEAGTSTMAELARRHEVHPNLIHKWVKQYRAKGDEAFKHDIVGDGSAPEAKVAELEQTIGQLTVVIVL